MRMDFIVKLKKEISKKRPDLIGQKGKKEVSDYSLSKALRQEYNVEISTNGLTNYSKLPSSSGRYDVTCALVAMSGVGWSVAGKWLDEEFLKGKK